MMRTLNLDGDRQADLSVHGGPSKAVYVYPAEHYDFWKREFPEMDLPWGMFGENFTTTGLLETEINIGDKFRIGAAEVMVTEPRMPCYKLGSEIWSHGHHQEILAKRAHWILSGGSARKVKWAPATSSNRWKETHTM